MNSERIQQLLAECPAGPPIAPIATPGRAEVEKAIRCSPSCAPGPDGSPFACYKGIGQLGVDVLTKVLNCLCAVRGEPALADMGLDGAGRHPHSEGLLVLLVEKPPGADPRGIPYFKPEGTRPLNIFNTDNRIVASAIRCRVDAPLAKTIGQHQRGLLPGRSMIENILDIEEEILTGCLKDTEMAAWFFDFKTALPSISHDYLHAAMKHMGLPGWLFMATKCFHNGTRCEISIWGGPFPWLRANTRY